MKKFLKIFSILLVFMLFTISTYADEMASIKLPVHYIDGANETLTYVLEDKETSNIKQQIELSKGESGNFELNYTESGTFYYVVKQVTGANKNVIYDQTIYEITVFVGWDENGNLYAKPIIFIDGQSGKYGECEFTNEFVETPPPSDTSSNIPSDMPSNNPSDTSSGNPSDKPSDNTSSNSPVDKPSGDNVQTGDSSTYLWFFVFAPIVMLVGVKLIHKKKN